MKRRMPAEWENPRKILMAYPHPLTDWVYILEEARAQFDAIIDALIDGGEFVWLMEGMVPERIRRRIEDNEGMVIDNILYNDTWTRDYGSITVIDHTNTFVELDFGFNGWGLQFAADWDNLVNLHLHDLGMRPDAIYENRRDFILEGGSIETDGKGTILTTSRCLCSPNRNGGKDKKEIEIKLKEYLGADRVLWLDHGFLEGDDTGSHIDTLARMTPDDTIVYVAPPKHNTDVHYQELTLMERQLQGFRTAKGEPYRLLPLPFPESIYDENGDRLPATYANYLVTAWNLFVPTYGQPENDRRAVETLKKAFPMHKVFTVDCRTLIRQHGSLHCSTMQLYT